VTKTAMRALARQATRHGYTREDDYTGRVTCPRCGQHVVAYKLAWERWTPAKWEAAFVAHELACNEASAS